MLRSISVFLALALSLMAVGCGGGEGGVGEEGVGQQQFTLSSTAFRNNEAIPLKYASAELGGQDVSPPLQWSNPPAGTRSFVITCIDLDARLDARNFVHWVVYDIPASLSGLPENVPKQPQPQVNGAQVKQGQNDFDGVGYGGPAPPQGETHRYQFTIYALSVDTLNLPAGATLQQVTQAMQGKILAQATLTGTFRRQ
jgi:Raf kinase inhibitor-like YbhB/YbcL family protein